MTTDDRRRTRLRLRVLGATLIATTAAGATPALAEAGAPWGSRTGDVGAWSTQVMASDELVYALPVAGEVRALFVRPAERWSAGHRGVDLAAPVGTRVTAPAAGTVTVVGTVVDRGVMTIAHTDGRRSSLEPVRALVARGAVVAAGEVVAEVTDEASHCTPTCLHWGVREGEEYVDPLGLLPGAGPVVLLPALEHTALRGTSRAAL